MQKPPSPPPSPFLARDGLIIDGPHHERSKASAQLHGTGKKWFMGGFQTSVEAPHEGTTITAAGVLGGPSAGGEEDLLSNLLATRP